ncbi:BTAD domain-containing putative transcriptional regulator [Streptomyces sp. NPDC127079]|uniref:AfsR/SARP family transcriptional regulator n=1 Tax=Streptomyces sp. NPDC127079 TaxID=3347132 RepID=UPI00365A3239
MRFEILGSLRITDGEDVITVSAPKMESLLAALLVRADDVVSMDQMCTEIWGDEPPRRATATLHVYVSQLRKLLGRGHQGESPIVTRSPGYVLCLGDSGLDAHEFQRLARQGRAAIRAGRYQEASAACGQALALWRGTVLGEVRGGPIVEEFATWAEETRLECVELRNEAELTLGRHRELVGPLYALVNRHPLIEAFHGQLMLALHRSHRRAEALRVFEHLRVTLDRELGIRPCRQLHEMHRRILADEESRVPAAA